MIGSKIIVANSSQELLSLTWVRPVGDADDHLRLAVILPLRLRARGDAEAAAACVQPKLAWSVRLSRLRDFLATLAPAAKGEFVGAIVDIDALYPGQTDPESTWNDPTFRKERAELLRVLLEALSNQSWLLVRPLPNAALSADLPAVEVGLDVTGSFSIIPPVLRPLVKYIREKKLVSEKTISRIVKNGAEDHNAVRNLIGMVYDALPRSIRTVAKQVSPVRVERPLNGVWGAFKIADKGAHTIPRNIIKVLCEAGILQSGVSPSTAIVPNAIRHFLARRAEVAFSEELQEEHRWLATQASATPTQGMEAEEALESHHHAVAARDFELAKKTATYYGTDLRIMAYQLSVAQQYKEAAGIYHHVVHNYDPSDAYSWEYYAFNLAKAPDGANNADEVLKAYAKAVELARDNPLYQGRLLGFRAEINSVPRDEVVKEASKFIAMYQMTLGPSAVSYFAEPVINGLNRAGHRTAAGTLLRKFPFIGHATAKATEW